MSEAQGSRERSRSRSPQAADLLRQLLTPAIARNPPSPEGGREVCGWCNGAAEALAPPSLATTPVQRAPVACHSCRASLSLATA
eukprot:10182827-Alexandrium_andersonii.AAC.1